ISTIAGPGSGFSGNGGLATKAKFRRVTQVAVDGLGNIYIADDSNCEVRMVSTSGIINDFAGDSIWGYSGDGGPAINAEIKNPNGVSIDANGNMYIAEWMGCRIRMIIGLAGFNQVTEIKESIKLFPNPTYGIFTFKSEKS